MAKSTKEILEQTLFLWSVVQNKILTYKERALIGRSFSPFEEDQYLDKEHLEIVLEDGQWSVIGRETTNGTLLNALELEAGKKIPLDVCDVIMAGDQILIVLDTSLISIESREDFLTKINLSDKKFAEQLKSIQNRSIAFFKLEFPHFVKLIQTNQVQKKIEIANAKKTQDLAPYDEKLAQIQQKRAKIEAAWNNKIAEFKATLEQIKES